jgi:hypothetical protein
VRDEHDPLRAEPDASRPLRPCPGHVDATLISNTEIEVVFENLESIFESAK